MTTRPPPRSHEHIRGFRGFRRLGHAFSPVEDTTPGAAAPAASWLRRSVHNFSALLVSEVVKVACNATATVYLARVLGVEGFGVYGLMLAVLGYLTAFVDGGFTLVGTRDVATDRSRLGEHVRTIIALRLALAIVALMALTLFTVGIDESPLVQRVLLLTGFSAITAALSLDWVFYGVERARPVALATVARSVLLLAAVVVLIRRPDQVWLVPLIQAGSEAVAVVMLAVTYERAFGMPELRVSWRACRARLLQTLPIGVAQLLRAVNYWFGVLLIGLLLDDSVVGQFVGAQKLMLFLLGFATMYFLTYLPVIAGALSRDVGQASRILSMSVRLTAALTLPVAIGGTVLAVPLVTMVYGTGFEESGRPFQILIWVLPIVILAAHFRNALIAARLQRVDLACVAASAAANVMANLLLVPRLGASGAAIAMTLSEVVLLVATSAAVSRWILRASIMGPLARPLAAGTVMAGLVWWAQPFGLSVAIVAGGTVYLALLWVTGGLRSADLAGLFRG